MKITVTAGLMHEGEFSMPQATLISEDGISHTFIEGLRYDFFHFGFMSMSALPWSICVCVVY